MKIDERLRELEEIEEKREEIAKSPEKPEKIDIEGIKNIPKPVRKVIFEKSEFSSPITLNLPQEDPPGTAQRLKSRKTGLPPIHISHARQIDEDVLDLLKRYGFVNIEKVGLRWSWSSPDRDFWYDILSYSVTIRPYICEGDFRYKPGIFAGFKIRLASRILKSIDYKNEYEEFPMGIKVKYYAVTFSYTLNKEFPYYGELQRALPREIPEINRVYKGKAKAYLDPDDGLWKLESISLS